MLSTDSGPDTSSFSCAWYSRSMRLVAAVNHTPGSTLALPETDPVMSLMSTPLSNESRLSWSYSEPASAAR